MPALPDVASVLRIDHGFTIGEDSEALVRNYWSYAGTAPTAGELDTLAAAIGSAYGSELKSLVTDDTTLESVVITDLTSNSAARGTAAPGVAGTLGSTLLAANTCMVNTLEIVRRYRGGHPREYWRAGEPSSLQDAQTWTTGFLGDWTTAYDTFVGAVVAAVWSGGGTFEKCNVSYYEGFASFQNPITKRYRNVPTPRVVPLVDPITSVISRVKIGTQKRRIIKSR